MSDWSDPLYGQAFATVNVLNYAAYTYARLPNSGERDSDALAAYAEEATMARNNAINHLLDLLRAVSSVDQLESTAQNTIDDNSYYPTSWEDARTRIARLRDYFYALTQEPNAEPLVESLYSQLDNTLIILETGDEYE